MDTAAKKVLEIDYLVFLILSYIGMRVGELVALKWKDIDFDDPAIGITKTYYNLTNNTIKYELVPPKTRRLRRKITIDEDIIKALQKHNEVQNKVKDRLGLAYHDKGFIFAKKERQPGYPIFIKTVENRMGPIRASQSISNELYANLCYFKMLNNLVGFPPASFRFHATAGTIALG
ncbi:tyrosine-type recombinase/integrase [Siminovitchia terrae]|uniref:tyrosine-type recombinase/integrase n=1 Tax=Siminovitchia terrae TaxID=1914933 RepID=UPI001FEAA611|nr:tyrosine-type recombinase/integrase [Siminovitchia terrae]